MPSSSITVTLTIRDPLKFPEGHEERQQRWLDETITRVAQEISGALLHPYESRHQIRIETRVSRAGSAEPTQRSAEADDASKNREGENFRPTDSTSASGAAVVAQYIYCEDCLEKVDIRTAILGDQTKYCAPCADKRNGVSYGC